jgi:hypothetical protein
VFADQIIFKSRTGTIRVKRMRLLGEKTQSYGVGIGPSNLCFNQIELGFVKLDFATFKIIPSTEFVLDGKISVTALGEGHRQPSILSFKSPLPHGGPVRQSQVRRNIGKCSWIGEEGYFVQKLATKSPTFR